MSLKCVQLTEQLNGANNPVLEPIIETLSFEIHTHMILVNFSLLDTALQRFRENKVVNASHREAIVTNIYDSLSLPAGCPLPALPELQLIHCPSLSRFSF